MRRDKALIFGASGQDGPYLMAALRDLGIEPVPSWPAWDHREVMSRPGALPPGSVPIMLDVTDHAAVRRVIETTRPQYIFNLAAITYVPTSWRDPELTMRTNGLAVVNMLEAIRQIDPSIRFYQASSSEMFGKSEAPQGISTPFRPVSPYAVAKLAAHHAVEAYRNSYGLFAVSGILFNHESPWRGPEFVTRHIARNVALARKIPWHRAGIGPTFAVRDWGHARDYMRVVARIVVETFVDPEDFVLATGEGHTVQEFIDKACAVANVSSPFIREQSHFRVAETADLIGDIGNLRSRSDEAMTPFNDLVEEMVTAEIERLR